MAKDSLPRLLTKARSVISQFFLKDFDDDQLTEMMEIVLSEINNITPMTYFSLCDVPRNWEPTIIIGLHVYLILALQMALGLKDFNYNDNGLSLSLNRVQNLAIPLPMYRKMFDDNAWNLKKPFIFKQGPKVLAYPRYQSAVSSFLRILFGTSWKQ